VSQEHGNGPIPHSGQKKPETYWRNWIPGGLPAGVIAADTGAEGKTQLHLCRSVTSPSLGLTKALQKMCATAGSCPKPTVFYKLS